MKDIAEKVINIASQGLSYGLGKPEPGKMCVEAAVCYAMGLPHGDNPTCVHRDVRDFKIALNDLGWPTDKKRGAGMMALAVAQLGSKEVKAFHTQLNKELEGIKFWVVEVICKDIQEKVKKFPLSEVIEGLRDLEDIDSDLEFVDCLPEKYRYEALLRVADAGLTALKKVKSPGCRYLKLVPKENMPKALIKGLGKKG